MQSHHIMRFLQLVPVTDDPAVYIDHAGMRMIQHEYAYTSMTFKINDEGNEELGKRFGQRFDIQLSWIFSVEISDIIVQKLILRFNSFGEGVSPPPTLHVINDCNCFFTFLGHFIVIWALICCWQLSMK